MLNVWVWVSMNFRHRPGSALFVQDHVPVDPGGRIDFEIVEDLIAPVITVLKVEAWKGHGFRSASIVGVAHLRHPQGQVRELTMQVEDFVPVFIVISVIWRNRNILTRR